MSFYTLWLLPAGLLGIILTLLRDDDVTIDNAPYVPFFALFMVIWGFLFIKLWTRKTYEYAFNWDTLSRVKKINYRPSFYGIWSKSIVTGEMELYYSSNKRKLKYLFSFFITLIMLIIAFIVMIASLNLQGYVSCHTRYGLDNPFHIKFLHNLSKSGELFDSNSIIMGKMPVIIHSIVIIILNQQIYSRIATKLTDWENHKTDEKYENALILKRFLFEAFDCYIALFYLAFFELDIIRLRSELMALYTSNCIRRVLIETLIPFLKHKLIFFLYEYKILKKRKNNNNNNNNNNLSLLKDKKESIIAQELKKDNLELFDDYLEMVIQYGYITLFASAFPFAPALSFITNIIEMKSDGFKVSFLVKKPQVKRVKSIGTWNTVLIIQTWISVITNVFLFGFSSEQMLQWFPSFFDHVVVSLDDISVIEQQLRMGYGRYAIFFIFALEHLLLLIGLCITFLLNDVPRIVRKGLARREYFRTREIKLLRHAAKEKPKIS